MRVGVLGPLELTDDHGRPVDLRATKQRHLLVALLTAPGREASVDRLVDELWGGRPPKSARANLQLYVHRLRQTIGDSRLAHRQGAYRLVLDDAEIDANAFVEHAERGRAAMRAGDAGTAADLLGEALQMWRGDAYDGYADLEHVRAEAGRLDELRLVALEDRVAADLAVGRHAVLVPELRTLVAQNPLRERIRGQLMRALYRSGRAAEALEAYRTARRAMVDELGIEPGQELRSLEQAVLDEDPALDLDQEASPAWRTPAELPPANRAFTGRRATVERAVRWLTAPDDSGAPTVVAINGPGGIGKSALALEVAHAVAGDFPDGQLYVNLHGATPGILPLDPSEVLRRLLGSLGSQDKHVPGDLDEAAAAFRSMTSGRRVLVLLDDAAQVAQVRPLLPGGVHSAVLVTSRAMLPALDSAHHLQVDALEPDEAVQLFTRLVGVDRVAEDADAATEVVDLCGRLPLAVRIAGARLIARPDRRLPEFAERLRGVAGRLDELEHADLAVRATFAISHDGLPDGPRELFEMLGLLAFPDFGVEVAAALVERDETTVRRELDVLVEAQLLTGAGDRYAVHDLLRLYAREQVVERFGQAARDAALRRVLHLYVATVRRAFVLLGGESGWPQESAGLAAGELLRHGTDLADEHAAAAWIEAEAKNLPSVLAHAFDLDGDGLALGEALSSALPRPLRTQGRLIEILRLSDQVLDRVGDNIAWHARIHNDRGLALQSLGRYDEAWTHYELSGALDREIGDSAGEATTLNNMGGICYAQGRLDDAIGYAHRALELRRRIGDDGGVAMLLSNLSEPLREQGRYSEALSSAEESVALHDKLGNARGRAISLGHLAEALRASGELERAIASFEDAIWTLRGSVQAAALPAPLWNLGLALHEAGREEEARTHWAESLDLLCRAGALTEEQRAATLEDPLGSTPDVLRLGA